MQEKSHTYEEVGAHLIICFLKIWKQKCWRYHHFIHVYQKPQSCEVQFLRYEDWKNKPLEVLSFYTIVPKRMIIGYTVLEIWHVTDVIVIFYFGQFFDLLHPPPHLPPQQPKKWKIQKTEKIPGGIIILPRYQNSWIYILFLRYSTWWM